MHVDSDNVGGRRRWWADSSTRGPVDCMEETFRKGEFIDDERERKGERGSETLTAVSRVSMGTKPPAPSQCGDRTLPKNYQIQAPERCLEARLIQTDGS